MKATLEGMGLSDALAKLLTSAGWTDPLQLQAAFDDDVEARALLLETRLKESPQNKALLMQWTTELVDWKDDKDWAAVRKRLRVGDFFERARASLPEVRPPSELQVTLGRCCSGKKWSSRLSSAQPSEDPDDRKKKEAKELLKWTAKFVGYFLEAGLPTAVEANKSAQPERVLAVSLGAKRARTVRSRWRCWTKVVLWLRCLFGVVFPTSASQMVDYLLDVVIYSGACSLPGLVAAALSFVEKAGGVLAKNKISTQGLWLAAVGNVAKQLQTGNVTVRKAPQPSRALLVALELVVCGEGDHFTRMLAFCRLLKVWACVRFDDLQALQPRTMRLSTTSLTGTLGSTKVSGPGKKHWELPIVILRSATLSGQDWVEAGFLLTTEECFGFERGYFLPAPFPSKNEYKKKILGYAECSAHSRGLTQALGLPKFSRASGAWEFVEDVLLAPEPAGLFWSEHSERHFLPSTAALAEVPKDTRDFVGRWHLGLHQSSDYVFTARQVVRGVQARVMEYLFSVRNLDDEEELMERFGIFLASKDCSGNRLVDCTRRHTYPFDSLGNGGLHRPWVGSESREEEPREEGRREVRGEGRSWAHWRGSAASASWCRCGLHLVGLCERFKGFQAAAPDWRLRGSGPSLGASTSADGRLRGCEVPTLLARGRRADRGG